MDIVTQDPVAHYWSVDTDEHGEPLEEKPELVKLPYTDDDLEYVAVHAAERYWKDGDGQIAPWPVWFTLYDKEKVRLGSCEVNLSYTPAFSAEEVEDG